MHCGVMSKHCDCLWLLNVIVICNVLYLCERPLNEIYCVTAFSLALNKSMIGFHAFFSLFERVISFYPFPTFCQSVMDYALKLYSYAWNSMVSGFFYVNENDCNAIWEESYISSSDEEYMEHFLGMFAICYHIKKL